MREGNIKEESIDVDNSACSSGLFTFNRPKKDMERKSDNDKPVGRNTEKSGIKVSDFEKMEDDSETGYMDTESDTPKQTESIKPVFKKGIKRPLNSDIEECRGNLKQKLDLKDITETSEMTVNAEKETAGFKSRKFSKRNIRSRQRQDDNDD